MVTSEETICISSKLTAHFLSLFLPRRTLTTKLTEIFAIKDRWLKHSMSLCQVRSCLVLVPYEVRAQRLCVCARFCSCRHVRLCSNICVNVKEGRWCARARVYMCAFCTSVLKGTSGVCLLRPAVVYSDSLPLRKPAGHCVCVPFVYTLRQSCGYVSDSNTPQFISSST